MGMGIGVEMGIRVEMGMGIGVGMGIGIGESDVHDGGLHVVHLADVMLDFVLGSEQLIERKAAVDFNPHYRMATDDSSGEESLLVRTSLSSDHIHHLDIRFERRRNRFRSFIADRFDHVRFN